MKHFILILTFFVASVAISHAQYANAEQITSRGSKILVNGEKLSTQQAAELFSNFGGTEMGDKYLKNRKGYRTGVGLAVSGASMIVVGYAATTVGGLLAFNSDYDSGNKTAEAIVYTGSALAITGALMITAGVPTAYVYKRRIKNSVNQYNSASGKPVLAFSPARSGIGVAMTF